MNFWGNEPIRVFKRCHPFEHPLDGSTEVTPKSLESVEISVLQRREVTLGLSDELEDVCESGLTSGGPLLQQQVRRKEVDPRHRGVEFDVPPRPTSNGLGLDGLRSRLVEELPLC